MSSRASFDLQFQYDGAERQVEIDQLFSNGTSRALKVFSYGTANGTVTTDAGPTTDYVQGKLQAAERRTYDCGNGDFSVKETYNYADAAGHPTIKTTKIDMLNPSRLPAVQTHYRTLHQSYAYDVFGNRTGVTYPTCDDYACGASTILTPVTSTYTNGRLTAVPNFASQLNYAPNGMLTGVVHANGVTDSQAVDPNGMARPHAITVSGWSSCTPPTANVTSSPPSPIPSNTSVTLTANGAATYLWTSGTTTVGTSQTYTTPPLTQTTTYRAWVTDDCGTAFFDYVVVVCPPPTISTQPASQTISPNQTATFSVQANTVGTLSYQWYQGASGDTSQPVGTNSASYTTLPLTVTTSYWVSATDVCGAVNSTTATATVCGPPTISTQPAGMTIDSGESAPLAVQASGSGTLLYQWYQGASGDTSHPVGSNATSYQTPALTVTTSYWVKVSNSCSSANSATATITVGPALLTPANMNATRSSSTQITVIWSASSGADHYKLDRESSTAGFQPLSDVFGTSFVDNSRVAGATYIYRVRAVNAAGLNTSAYSNYDLATMMTFTPVQSGGPIVAVPAVTQELLTALNAMRAAHGDGPTTWAAVLPAQTPAPASNVLIYANHINYMRAAMDTALQNLGVAVPSGPVVKNKNRIAATHIQQLQVRAQ